VDVHVNARDFDDVSVELLSAAVILTLEREGYDSGEISLTLLSDEEIQELNREYLGRDVPTDVLAFALGDGDEPLGDVYVGLHQARRQASELAVPIREELVRLAVHGTLHVLGHDHPDGAERIESPMFTLQELLVTEILAEGSRS